MDFWDYFYKLKDFTVTFDSKVEKTSTIIKIDDDYCTTLSLDIYGVYPYGFDDLELKNKVTSVIDRTPVLKALINDDSLNRVILSTPTKYVGFGCYDLKFNVVRIGKAAVDCGENMIITCLAHEYRHAIKVKEFLIDFQNAENKDEAHHIMLEYEKDAYTFADNFIKELNGSDSLSLIFGNPSPFTINSSAFFKWLDTTYKSQTENIMAAYPIKLKVS